MLAVLFGWSIFYFTEPTGFFTFMGRLFAPGLAGFADIEAQILWRQHLVFIIIAIIGSTPLLPWLKIRLKRPLNRIVSSRVGYRASTAWCRVTPSSLHSFVGRIEL